MDFGTENHIVTGTIYLRVKKWRDRERERQSEREKRRQMELRYEKPANEINANSVFISITFLRASATAAAAAAAAVVMVKFRATLLRGSIYRFNFVIFSGQARRGTGGNVKSNRIARVQRPKNSV
jgi:hypothetical protein